MKKILKSNLILVLAILALVSFNNVKAFAASTTPYGHTYTDSVSGKTIYNYYSYTGSTYKVTRSFYAVGNCICNNNETILYSSPAGTTSKHVGFDKDGNLYIISTSGKLVECSTSGKLLTILEKGAVSLQYNNDDLVEAVKTESETLSITNLSPIAEKAPESKPEADKKANNRVEMYENSNKELVYTAYQDGKVKLTIVVSKDGKKVLNQTDKVRLSDTLFGAKFMGIDSKYNVYFYESNGAVYRFKNGSWYSAEKISIAEKFKSFKTNDNGFITEVRTSKNSYTIKQLTTADKWKATKNYIVKKDKYMTMYLKGSTKSHTLSIKSKVLYLDGKEIAKKVTNFGFVNSKKFAYTTKSGKTYVAAISKPTSKSKISNAEALLYLKHSMF